ncbi:MAG: hypothetical protein ACH34U_12825 [Cyanobium sp.]
MPHGALPAAGEPGDRRRTASGFDGMAGDPLANLQLTTTDVADLTGFMKTLATRHAKGRLVSLLEGGYGLGNLAKGTAAHVEALLVG